MISATVSNIKLITSSNRVNTITAANANNFCGGVFGVVQSSLVFNITIENTVANFPTCTYVGGMFGYAHFSLIASCFNLGKEFFSLIY